jgi:UDP-2,4-diacetamido-2,4,6-trideoxy-beta-L-altropyranose hydrolase
MRVVFRADASIRIGTGHVMRCLALADELTLQGHHCRFVCREHEGHLGGLIATKGYELHLLPCSRSAETQPSGSAGNPYADWLGVPWQHDAEQTLELLSSLEADWLVVDHYALDARWERQVAKAVNRIMVIDDLAERHHECTLLLDQNLGRDVSDYDRLTPKNCLRLIGPQYALLRPEFSQLRERSLQRRKHSELKRILISLGGVDKTNVTGHVLDALANTPLPADTELDIIMGASAPYLDEVRQQAKRLPFKATVNVNVSDMAERMCLADFSIGAAGSTSWERCCLGLPTVIVFLADNQASGGKALEAAGAALTIDEPKAVRAILPAALAEVSIPKNLQRMSYAATAITEGKGASSVATSMIAMSGRSQ